MTTKAKYITFTQILVCTKSESEMNDNTKHNDNKRKNKVENLF